MPPSPSLDLTLTLTQTSTSPPTLLLTVLNTSPSVTYTLLTWSSPLDPAALALGLISVRTPADNKPFPIANIMLKRVVPTSNTDDAFVTLAPGESASSEVVFRDPVVDMDGLRTAALAGAGAGADKCAEGGKEEAAVLVQFLSGTDSPKEDEDEGGVTVWVGKRREELAKEDLESLGRGGSATRWKIRSEVVRTVV
ncbi:hypothetical protein B0T17DRAFT_500634 [Bombardia bombarda]|uniref:Uncharacterized protein n=1 Tax=Bombardia bombarda TaxID=252184 RepID=A0AA39U476_9PEZI|nr:hypothetical protein B0T17DRAFT_500634 [Bombardia bombarda]